MMMKYVVLPILVLASIVSLDRLRGLAILYNKNNSNTNALLSENNHDLHHQVLVLAAAAAPPTANVTRSPPMTTTSDQQKSPFLHHNTPPIINQEQSSSASATLTPLSPLRSTPLQQKNVTVSFSSQPQNSNGNNNNDYSGPSLWLTVDEFSEGMASWRIGLTEVMAVARKLNATLVEPCILGGRLLSCAARGATYRLGDLYDLQLLRQFHRYIVPYEEYQNMVQRSHPNMIAICLARPGASPHAELLCNNGRAGMLPNVYGNERMGILEQVYQDRHQQPNNNTSNTVIRIQYYRKGGFAQAKWPFDRQQLVPLRRVKRVLATNFEFRKVHHDTVTTILGHMGISTNATFDAIHWRAEVPRLDYDRCVEQILAVRRSYNSDNTNEIGNSIVPTVLLSSLNSNAGLQWSMLFKQGLAARSLKQLADAGMHKIDHVSRETKIDDMVVLAAWDQIIATRARNFATCSKSCPHTDLCAACNYRGNYGGLAIDLRKKEGKTSDQCWPTVTAK